ncbi:hypothetical protein BBJ28_00020015 [Nothophytophthora sp. Chile5]|nr:hypothetical protein BBJ28_00020015 [Nothophytophthora sp. Chile5]
MAPEVYAAKEAYDPLQADMWSLGVLLTIMLTGAPLVEKPNCDDRQFRVLHRSGVRKLARVFPKKPTEEAWDLLERLLDTEPTQRPTLEEVSKHPFLSETECLSDSWQRPSAVYCSPTAW